ncbi:FAD-dependent oxidoreductase [Uliginosibacterium sp. sgz301328]|uniref:FAD-dependent oxidoreductase n=1 Tax=Uliginosibacterium sp. sgz301328 TaxID=3243764 RepID=UPI00359E1816
MAEQAASPRDLRAGIPVDELEDGAIVAGQVDGEEAILVRSGTRFFAIGALCSHYHEHLVKGLVVDCTIRCPLHHASFDLATGEAVRAPAFDPLPCWRVEHGDGTVFVGERMTSQTLRENIPAPPTSVVIVGGGAAGFACADMLRREGYKGPVTMVCAEETLPCDRPNLSKDNLAGTAPEEWIYLRPAQAYADQRIELLRGLRVTAIDTGARTVALSDGNRLPYGALLLATGAEPVRLEIPGADPARVHVLRSVADNRAIVAQVTQAQRAIVVGASFIGLEVAASLRERGVEVHVVAPDSVPMQRVMGEDIGRFVQALHEAHGVVFHLGTTVARMDGTVATLANGDTIDADLIVLGVGVRPATALAEQAGLAVERGVSVDAHLQTSAPGVYAAGDIARWPDPHTGERMRVEHWVVATRQGQVAARNMLGRQEVFDAVPFFWSQHYDVMIHYVGHAEGWDAIEVDGVISDANAQVRYKRDGRTLAVATIGRDLDGLKAEFELERASPSS